MVQMQIGGAQSDLLTGEITGVVRDAVRGNGNPEPFLAGLEYGLTLAGLWLDSRIQRAWDEGRATGVLAREAKEKGRRLPCAA